MISTVLAASSGRTTRLHDSNERTMSDDDIFYGLSFPETRSRSSSISNTRSTGSGSKAIVPVGRIIHRVDLAGPTTTISRQSRRREELRAQGGIRSLVPLDDRDVPYFCPDTKHTASLHRVSNVYQELNTERAWLVTENDKVTRQKRMVIDELRQLELTLKQLMERKGALQKGLVTLQTKEDSTVTQIDALDKKIGLIGEKSVEFEEVVRGIAGTPQYELGPNIESLDAIESESRCLRVLEGHTGAVRSLVASGEEMNVYSCGDDGTLRMWDASMFACTGTLKTDSHDDTIPLSCVSVYESMAAVGNEDGEVTLWDLSSRTEMHKKQCHLSSVVECVQLSGECYFTGSADYTAQVWDLPTSSCQQQLKGHTGSVKCLRAQLEKDWGALATGSMDGTVKLWDTRQSGCLRTWQVDSSGVTGLVFDDSRVFTTDNRGTIKVWDLKAGSVITSLNVGSPISCIAKSGEGSDAVITVGSVCGKIHVCAMVADVLKPMPSKLEGHTGAVTSICASGSTVWSGGTDNTIRMWRLPDTASTQWRMDVQANSSLQTNFFGLNA
eukprot:TRINITY_DN7783_c0_g2_i2.p1 TRINITY_DN7783_c0_g2~~TRINITY_DN7783_c0_g2_i2.p1  ORF type:complete len:555 (-),score=86.87 TRINITY_DN7783_c0_g2_i2:238-1902(-)